jgi:hypothetical protein
VNHAQFSSPPLEDGSLQRLINYGLQFETSQSISERFKAEILPRFNIDFVDTDHLYLPETPHQYNGAQLFRD